MCRSSSSFNEYSEDSVDEALLLKTAVAMIERRAIPKIGSFIDIVLSYDNQEFRTNFRLSRGILNICNMLLVNRFIFYNIGIVM
jgi:hypothetical protein